MLYLITAHCQELKLIRVKELEGGSDEKSTTGLDGLHERCQVQKLGRNLQNGEPL